MFDRPIRAELALAATAAIRPELILLDIRMPGMNGFEVCRILKEREETREIPIVFISATADTGERLEGWRLGRWISCPSPSTSRN